MRGSDVLGFLIASTPKKVGVAFGKPACCTPDLSNTLRQSLTPCSTPFAVSPTASAMSEGRKISPPLTAPHDELLIPSNVASGATVRFQVSLGALTGASPAAAGRSTTCTDPFIRAPGASACDCIAENVSGSTGTRWGNASALPAACPGVACGSAERLGRYR